MAKRHKMTPRRRAALKRAQAASARKRRKGRVKSVLKGIGTTAGFVGATFATYHMNRYIVRPDQFARESAAGVRAVKKAGKAGFRKATGKKTIPKSGNRGTPNHIGYL